MFSHDFKRRVGAVALTLFAMASAEATTVCSICTTTPFINLENDALNSDGEAEGQFLRFGDNAVTAANGSRVSGTWTTPAVPGFTGSMALNSSPALPNFYSEYLNLKSSLVAANPSIVASPFNVTYTAPGEASTSQTLQLASNAQLLPYVNSITLSGSSLEPTFSWTPPAGTTPGVNVNGYRVNIYDKSLITPGDSGQVSSASFGYTTTSYTIRPADFTLANYQFNPAHQYVVQISAIQTIDGSNSNFSNSNIASISRIYADFTPLPNNSPVVNLPVVYANGAWAYNMAVVAGQTYYIDPALATGYEYATAAGDPNFASVTLPTGVGGGEFQLWDYSPAGVLQFVTDLAGGVSYDFGPAGVSFFEVTGIDPGLNPSDTTAFVTGLSFVASGMFNGTQTPIVTQAPEPGTLAIVALGLTGLTASRRSVRRNARR